MKRFIPVENLSYLIFSLTIFFSLLANPVKANTSDQLLGSWRGSVNEESVLLEFKTSNLLIYDGDQVQYHLIPGVIQAFTPEGLSEIPYRLQNGILTLTMAQDQVDFHREDELSAGKQKHIDQLIIQLLNTYNWKSWSYSGASSTEYGYADGDSLNHSHSREKSGKLSFFPNGTYIWGEKTESHYTGSYSAGSGVDLASNANTTGTDGKWRINNGDLYASQGNSAMERVDFLIKCNMERRHEGKDPFFLTPDGNLNVVNGEIRCNCSGSPILVIDGTEYMVN